MSLVQALTRGDRGQVVGWRAVALVAALALATCAPKPEPLLDADRLIGSTPEQLGTRLGEPRVHNEETSTHYGSMRWSAIEGVDLMVIIKGAKATYITYHFVDMKPFDEAAALAQCGVELPDAEPQLISNSPAKRWRPCGVYERLTINPDTKLLSIGKHPM